MVGAVRHCPIAVQTAYLVFYFDYSRRFHEASYDVMTNYDKFNI